MTTTPHSDASSGTGATDASAVAKAPRYWRSLSELSGDESFTNDFLHREFPVAASEFPDGISRRRWMQLMSASLAMAGVAGCRYPEELIAPFVVRPEGRVPGEQYFSATNIEIAGEVRHLLVRCVDGRPNKVEPNRDHPAGGVTGTYAQAAMLELYDPDRARGETGVPIHREGKKRVQTDWDSFIKYGTALMRSGGQGERFAVLMSPTTSPTTLRMLAKLQSKMPAASVCVYDSVSGGVMGQATKKVFGKESRQDFDLSDAKVIVSIQSDLLGSQSGAGDNARTFAKSRDPLSGQVDPVVGKMSRLYVAEGGFTTTGVAADARISLRPSQMPALIAELGRRIEKAKSGTLAKAGMPVDAVAEAGQAYNEIEPQERLERFLDSAASDLAAAGDKGVVVVGEALGADMIAAGINLNSKLGSLGSIQKFSPIASTSLKNLLTLTQLVEKMHSGHIDEVFIIDTNVVYSSPGDIDFAEALTHVEHSIYLGLYDDETAAQCEWSLPLAHPFETWGDCIGREGHYGVCQPQILPLLGGQSPAEVLAVMMGEEEFEIKKLVRRTADNISGSAISDRQWRKLLHDGYADDMIMKTDAVVSQSGSVDLPAESPVLAWDYGDESFKNNFEVIFTPAEGLFDGRFANNGWLQEMPHSVTKLTWDNAAIMSPRTAQTLGAKHGLMVALRNDQGEVELPVFEVPGCAPGVVSVAIGYGRTRVGMVGGMPDEGVPVVGVDVSAIRSTDSMMLAKSLQARPRLNEYQLCATQDHWAIDELGREEAEDRSFMLIREGTTALLDKLPEFAEAKGPHVPRVGFNGSLWREPIARIMETKERLPQWGMSVDLTKCLGCNDCVIACQSENNVPIVGKEQVGMSREMHWLRIDRYFQGDEDHADIVQQPVACMHCETAPCEQVCPVAATVHTDEGLNAMAYNRCIGTRYCANNCPFKVRRFNYFNFNEDVGVGYGIDAYPGSIEEAPRKLQALSLNPDVTVRGRGVMEKCTYCVQRIEGAKIDARKAGRTSVADGAIVTACQAACPTGAIEFGNIADPESRVAKAKEDIRSYGMLGQLNVKPRTSYLARIRNTPAALMTRVQLEDLAHLHAPHHGHDDPDGDAHDTGEHEHGDESGEHAHEEGEQQALRNRARFSLPIV